MKTAALHLLAIWWYVTALTMLWAIPPHLFFIRGGMTSFTVSYLIIMYMAVAWYAPTFNALARILQ